MKKQSLRIFLMFSLFAILAASSAQAQSAAREQAANIPFSFNIGNQTFAAGMYTVARLNPQSDATALVIKSEDGRARRIVLTSPVQANKAQEKARLVFNRYGDQYFLAQVWTQADDTGFELRRSRSESTQLARARTGQAPEQIAITLGARRR